MNDFYTAARKADRNQTVAVPSPCDSFAALTRRQFVVRRYNLSRTEFELLQAIQSGQTLEQAVQHAASMTDSDMEEFASNLKVWFRNWTAEGFFQSVELPR